MPGEPGEMEARVPSLAVTGLQHNVIAMALWCKKGGTSYFKGWRWYRQCYSYRYWHYGYHGPKA